MHKFNFYKLFYRNLSENTLGDKIRKYRLQLGLTQDEFSKITGILRSNINAYESNVSMPSKLNINKLKKIIDM